jgi:hypothetical protein
MPEEASIAALALETVTPVVVGKDMGTVTLAPPVAVSPTALRQDDSSGSLEQLALIVPGKRAPGKREPDIPRYVAMK